MKAVHVTEFGVDAMQVADVAEPSAGRGEVLLATEAAIINPADFAVVTGAVAARLPWGSAPPYTPAWDLVSALIVFSGQFCMTGSRLLVHERIADRARRAAARRAGRPRL
jgi:hypothetical protein